MPCSTAITRSGLGARSSRAPSTGPVAMPGSARAAAVIPANAAPCPRASTRRTTATAVISLAMRPISAAANRRCGGRAAPGSTQAGAVSAVKHQELDEPSGLGQGLQREPRVASLELLEAVGTGRDGHGTSSDPLAAANVVGSVADHEGRIGVDRGTGELGGHVQRTPRDAGPIVPIDAEGAAREVLRQPVVLELRLRSRRRVPGQEERDDILALGEGVEDLDHAGQRASLTPPQAL